MTIDVSADAFNKHAANLDESAGKISTQSCALGGVNLGDGCFGVMNAWMPPVINHFFVEDASTVQDVADLVGRAADAIRETAKDFTLTDEEVASIFEGS